ncbi:integrase core domain containing protein family [Trichomonas vaginalis G3]|uniref:integrase core domain containing protein family n=1 Tax=Trichomonas vaginalis (strain ATCC PRA-98 / G3) TaxID=412133 RepID=UPI0021E5A0CF|nr:integrase core domain containing protein family [Trichomonas vaginalis G3]KAI5545241.1 integrase core domain containing protein family [Trichomonas vaginalis G3]
MNAYQFDTLINGAGNPPYFLVFININTRKGFVYPMQTKNSVSVYEALKKFINDTKNDNPPKIMTSDEDGAYKEDKVQQLMIDNGIEHLTTQKYNHSRLGIINRFIQTLRQKLKKHLDLHIYEDNIPPFTVQSMDEVLKKYNNTIHGSTDVKPKDFSEANNEGYVKKMMEKESNVRNTKDFNLSVGQNSV